MLSVKEFGQSIADYSYDGAGNMTSRMHPMSGASMSASYNVNNWSTGIRHDPASLADFVYEVDPEGHFESEEKRHHTNNSRYYTFDGSYRLLDFEEGTLSNGIVFPLIRQGEFEYDPAGNRISADDNGTMTSYTSNALNQYTAIVQGASINPLHDANGNLTYDGSNNYDYDDENRLISVNGGATASYKYDPLGRRIEKQTASETIKFFYDGVKVIEEVDAGGNVVASYVYCNGVDELLTMNRNGNTYYYHEDALGSVIALSDAGGNVVERYEYDPYGAAEVLDNSFNSLPASTVDNPYTFTSGRYDAETGLMFFRSRYYDSKTGRFISRDPIGTWGDAVNMGNAYTYVGNDPVSNIDPDGQKKRRWWKKIKKFFRKIFKRKHKQQNNGDGGGAFLGSNSNLTESCSHGSWPAPREIKLKFKKCSANQKNRKRERICPTFLGAGRAWTSVKNLFKRIGTEADREVTRRRVVRHFGEGKSEVKKAHLRMIQRKMRKIFKAFNRRIKFQCEGATDNCSEANAWTRKRVGKIFICPNFWENSPRTQSGTLYHEMSHRYGNADDFVKARDDAYTYTDFFQEYYR